VDWRNDKITLKLLQRVAANLRRLRTERAWSQEAAAHACGMIMQTYQRIEAAGANVTMQTLARLVDGFDLDDVRELLKPARA
jgi:transcriptional regulator with XRE-family HTH domain